MSNAPSPSLFLWIGRAILDNRELQHDWLALFAANSLDSKPHRALSSCCRSAVFPHRRYYYSSPNQSHNIEWCHGISSARWKADSGTRCWHWAQQSFQDTHKHNPARQASAKHSLGKKQQPFNHSAPRESSCLFLITTKKEGRRRWWWFSFPFLSFKSNILEKQRRLKRLLYNYLQKKQALSRALCSLQSTTFDVWQQITDQITGIWSHSSSAFDLCA